MSRSRPVSLVLVGLFVWTTGCHSYRQIELGELSGHEEVRVTLSNGERQILHDPWTAADSIKGRNWTTEGKPGAYWIVEAPPTTVVLSEVVNLEAKSNDTWATIALVMGIIVVPVAIAWGICLNYCTFG